MSKERTIYDVAFKRQAVDLDSQKKNKSELTRELGVAASLLYKWCKAQSI